METRHSNNKHDDKKCEHQKSAKNSQNVKENKLALTEHEIWSAKDSARKKRQRFLPPSEFRYGKLGGQSVGCFDAWSRWGRWRENTIEMEVKAPFPQDFVKFVSSTPDIASLVRSSVSISLNKQKRWETYPNALQAADPSSVTHTKPEKSYADGHRKVEIFSYEFPGDTYYDDAPLANHPQDDRYKITYVKDRFSKTIYNTQRQKEYWRCEAKRPQHIKEPRVTKLKLSARSVGHGSSVQMAVISYVVNYRPENANAVWMPKSDDRDDFLEVDLLREYIVTAVGTKGRPAPRSYESYDSHKYRKDVDVYRDNHWVSKYKLSFRTEKSGSQWVEAGEFRGNSDRCTEVAQKLNKITHLDVERTNKTDENESKNDSDLSSTRRGVVARYLRFQPLSREQGGFHGKKAMRVAVYGMPFSRGKKGDGESQETQGNSTAHVGTRNPGVKVSIHSSPNSEETNTRFCRKWKRRGSIDDVREAIHKRDRQIWKSFCREEKKKKSFDCFTVSVEKPRTYFSYKGFYRSRRVVGGNA